MTAIVAHHVSSAIYAPGQKVVASGPSPFLGGLLSDAHYQRLEDVLDATRGEGMRSRKESVFAYPTAGACRAFWDAEQRTGKAAYQLAPQFYRVSMPAPTRVPSQLIARTSRLLQTGRPHIGSAMEFWNPKHSWRCWEFMDREFTVLSVIAAPSDEEVEAYRAESLSDFRQANGLWPLPPLVKPR